MTMKYVDEYRDPALITAVAHEIRRTVDPARHYRIMEVCGGHTHAIYRHGLHDILPDNVELVHGPGCPVCVLPTGRVDDGLAIAAQPNAALACFGDMMRVPGTKGTPLELKARGGDIRMVYSPLDALKMAQDDPRTHVCFFAIGFETTAPSTALTLLRARELGVRNFSVFCNHVTIVPAMRAILDSPDMRLDGFVGPGHVSSIIGCRPYEFVAQHYGLPVVVAGFEPLDLLEGILMVLRQLRDGEAKVENQYRRIVPWEGNHAALRALATVFELRPTSSGAAWASSRSRRSSSNRPSPRGTPRSSSRFPAYGSPIRAPRSAARSSRACSSRRSASCSARNATRSIPSARSWSRARVRARRITAMRRPS